MSERSFDTNILIDALHGHQPAFDEMDVSDLRWISRVSWIEVMVHGDNVTRAGLESFLSDFAVDELDERTSRRAAELRRDKPRLKLPDAIILASAQVNGRTLVTRNTRDFPAEQPGVRVPYTL